MERTWHLLHTTLLWIWPRSSSRTQLSDSAASSSQLRSALAASSPSSLLPCLGSRRPVPCQAVAQVMLGAMRVGWGLWR